MPQKGALCLFITMITPGIEADTGQRLTPVAYKRKARPGAKKELIPQKIKKILTNHFYPLYLPHKQSNEI